MDDAMHMRIRQRISYFTQHPPDFWKGQCALHAYAVAEVVAFDESHDEIGETVFLVDGIDLNDVRMIQSRGGFRFAHESLTRVGPECEIGRQQLDRYIALEPAVACAIDNSSPATPDLSLDLICGSERAFDASAKL